MSLYSYSDQTIAGIIILGGMSFAALSVLALCSLLAWCRWYSEGTSMLEGRRRSNNSLVPEQSQSIVRGDHPIAFMLPTVSLSEVGSETDQTVSDMESLSYQSSRPGSPYSSLASLTGSNIYSSAALLSPSHTFCRSPSPSNSPRSLPLRIPSSRQGPRCSSLPPSSQYQERDGREEGALGKVGVRLTSRRSKGELQVKVLQAQNIPTNYKTRTANISIKIAVLPSRLPKYSTTVVEDSQNPEFNEDFTFLLDADSLFGKVVRLTITNHDRGSKNVIGYCLVSLEEAGLGPGAESGDLVVREAWLSVRETVKDELTVLLADKLQLSLRYDPDPGRLTLGIMEGRICSLPQEGRDLDMYVKVTLMEGRHIIKAKKTRLLACQDFLSFQEKFSILLPGPYLESVSCLVSLCSRSKFGTKAVLGRTCVGPWAYASGVGLEQWLAMSNRASQDIVQWHDMT